MSHHHHDHDHIKLRGKKLILTIILNFLITIVQIIGAIFANSLALLSDAFHNFSDTSSLILSYIANNLTKRKSTKSKTFGYKRAEIIAAFINSSLLLVIALYLMYEAFNRIVGDEHVEVEPKLVMIMAAFSIVANGLSVLIIGNDGKSNMNMRSAYLHLFSDMLSSIAVLIGGAAIYFFDLTVIDPILSVMIAIYLIIFGWKLVIQSLKVLMQFVPPGIDVELIMDDLSKFSGIKNIHHVHAWQLNDDEIIFDAHIDFQKNLSISETCIILEKIRLHLLEEYHIHHTTLQPEFEQDCEKNMLLD